MEGAFQTINHYIQEHRQEMVDKLTELVNLEGHTLEKENVQRALQWVRTEFEQEGFSCNVIEVAPDRCGILTGILGADRPGKPILFSGHIDTVFYKGTFNGENPCYVEDGKIYGPGALDMKGGIIIALYVVKALNEIQYEKHPIKILFVGEEETDHDGNDGNLIIMEESKGMLCAFNFEYAEFGNELSIGQKCQIDYNVKVEGKGGHAGNDFLVASNAVHEAVMKACEIIKLTDLEKGTTVTASVIHGGDHQTAIPERCDFVVDVRANGAMEQERIEASMEEILSRTYVAGTTTTYSVYHAKMRPYVETAEITKLFDLVNNVAIENGFPAFGKMLKGGTTDAGNIAAAGIPVLCGCGIRGEYAHNKKEYGVIDSLYDRAAIFATAVSEM